MLGPMVYGCAYTAVSQKDAMAKRCAFTPCCTLLYPATPCYTTLAWQVSCMPSWLRCPRRTLFTAQ